MCLMRLVGQLCETSTRFLLFWTEYPQSQSCLSKPGKVKIARPRINHRQLTDRSDSRQVRQTDQTGGYAMDGGG
jgi:hypothetical protein